MRKALIKTMYSAVGMPNNSCIFVQVCHRNIIGDVTPAANLFSCQVPVTFFDTQFNAVDPRIIACTLGKTSLGTKVCKCVFRIKLSFPEISQGLIRTDI